MAKLTREAGQSPGQLVKILLQRCGSDAALPQPICDEVREVQQAVDEAAVVWFS